MDDQLKLTKDEEAELRIHNVIKSVIPNQQIEDKIREHTASDQELTDIPNYMVHGDSGRFGKRRFGKNMAADDSAKKICRNVLG